MSLVSTISLVESDSPSSLTVTYEGVDLTPFTDIQFHIRYEDTTRLTLSLVGGEVVVTDAINGIFRVDFGVDDLIRGTHEAEFEFITASTNDTIPKESTIRLEVRPDIS